MSQKEVLVLVATHFDEIPTVYCLCKMRTEGFLTKLVGLTPGLQTGLCGLKVRPDAHLSEIVTMNSTNGRRLVILTGGDECRARLLSDPRVHQLVAATLKDGGFVAAMAPTLEAVLLPLRPTHAHGANHLLLQREMETTEFVDKLIDCFSI